jgi:hypothetical protein
MNILEQIKLIKESVSIHEGALKGAAIKLFSKKIGK